MLTSGRLHRASVRDTIDHRRLLDRVDANERVFIFRERVLLVSVNRFDFRYPGKIATVKKKMEKKRENERENDQLNAPSDARECSRATSLALALGLGRYVCLAFSFGFPSLQLPVIYTRMTMLIALCRKNDRRPIYVCARLRIYIPGKSFKVLLISRK